MICQVSGIYHVVPDEGFFSLFPNFNKETFVSMFDGVSNLFGAAFDVSKWSCSASGNTGWQLMKTLDFAIICFAFRFSDFFDSIGTINGAMAKTPLMKEDGTIPRLRGALLSDSIATCFGGLLGTSTVTMFAESATGIAAGARTGLAAVTGAVLFLLAPIAAPVFIAIPGFATAPALIFVGFLMLRTLKAIDLDDVSGALPAFLTVCGMAFTYSISDGLGIGIISWTILNCRIKGRVNWLLWLVTLIFVAKYIFL
jgi:AGZA family xanthine/uracil permease-like MFS transporter